MSYSLYEVYNRKPYRGSAASQPTFHQAKSKLGLLGGHAGARQALYDLEHRKLPKGSNATQERVKTFMTLVDMAFRMGAHGNINVQQGLKDILQILGYTDLNKLMADAPQSMRGNRAKLYMQTYLF